MTTPIKSKVIDVVRLRKQHPASRGRHAHPRTPSAHCTANSTATKIIGYPRGITGAPVYPCSRVFIPLHPWARRRVCAYLQVSGFCGTVSIPATSTLSTALTCTNGRGGGLFHDRFLRLQVAGLSPRARMRMISGSAARRGGGREAADLREHVSWCVARRRSGG